MVTQKDIAQKMGVSVSLVSRALSGTATEIGVPASTVARIRKTAASLGYQPNLSARILKGAPARTFGVVVYDFEDPFFGPLVGELQRLAHEQGFSLVLGGFERRHAWGLDVNALLKHQIDGLLIIGSDQDMEWARPFLKQGMPVARIGTGPQLRGLHSVEIDNQQGVNLLVQHLVEAGCRRIGFVGAEQASHRLRLDCLRAALRATRLPLRASHLVIRPEHASQAGYEAGLSMIKRSPRSLPDAIIAASDWVALGVLRAFAEQSVEIPKRLRLAGYDDIPAARLSVPSLTTIRQPVAEMARTAFEWIVATERDRKRKTVFTPELVVRESA